MGGICCLVAPAHPPSIGRGNRASRDPAAAGHVVLRQLLRGGFRGPVYPVNPAAHAVASVRAYPSLLDVPDDVDLAVIAVPAELLPGVINGCVKKRVGAVVVLSAGFAEVSMVGQKLQEEIVHTARAAGMRLVGPNCLGLLNTAPDFSLNATFGTQSFAERGDSSLVTERSSWYRTACVRRRAWAGDLNLCQCRQPCGRIEQRSLAVLGAGFRNGCHRALS